MSSLLHAIFKPLFSLCSESKTDDVIDPADSRPVEGPAAKLIVALPMQSVRRQPGSTAWLRPWKTSWDASNKASPVRRFPTFKLPAGAGFLSFPVKEGQDAIVRVEYAASGRLFGDYAEKTLACNAAAREAIDLVCEEGGFTSAWLETPGRDGFFTMEKLPVIIFVKLMLGLPEEKEDVVRSLIGAFAICMRPEDRTCMNVIAGRRPNGKGGYVLDKFSLYYPDNAAVGTKWGTKWDLLQGYSFRTAALTGSLNRTNLKALRDGMVPCAEGADFDQKKHGLVIDDASEYEDCAYVQSFEESDEERIRRIDGLVAAMVAAYPPSAGILALSYDPEEQEKGMTVLQSEWELLKKQLGSAQLDN